MTTRQTPPTRLLVLISLLAGVAATGAGLLKDFVSPAARHVEKIETLEREVGHLRDRMETVRPSSELVSRVEYQASLDGIRERLDQIQSLLQQALMLRRSDADSPPPSPRELAAEARRP